MSRLELGRSYSYDGWVFVVVRVVSDHDALVLCLTDFRRRFKAGEVTGVFENSAVARCAKEVA